jgi:hypothetical protein
MVASQSFHLAHHSFALQPQAPEEHGCQKKLWPVVRKEKSSLLTRNNTRVIIRLLFQYDSKVSPHTKTSETHLDTSQKLLSGRGESATHEFQPATTSAAMRQSILNNDARKQVSPSRVILF